MNVHREEFRLTLNRKRDITNVKLRIIEFWKRPKGDKPRAIETKQYAKIITNEQCIGTGSICQRL